MSHFMILIPEPRLSRFLIACTVLGVAVASGCESKPVTPDGPPANLQPKIKRLQDVKTKADSTKK
jgi:hypothetical protein